MEDWLSKPFIALVLSDRRRSFRSGDIAVRARITDYWDLQVSAHDGKRDWSLSAL
jgi:hypothetical protein